MIRAGAAKPAASAGCLVPTEPLPGSESATGPGRTVTVTPRGRALATRTRISTGDRVTDLGPTRRSRSHCGPGKPVSGVSFPAAVRQEALDEEEGEPPLDGACGLRAPDPGRNLCIIDPGPPGRRDPLAAGPPGP